MTDRARAGFTMVELIIVTVLGALVVGAAFQILIANQRTYTAQNAKIQGQQSTRAAMDILSSELREISAQGGDIIAMGADSIEVRVMRKYGVACAVDTTSTPKLKAFKVGDWFEADDSVLVFADNKLSSSADDTWIQAKVTSVDTTQNCGGTPAQELTFSGQSSIFSADSVRTGAGVRSFTYFVYGLYSYGGEPYLARKVPGSSSVVPMVGPLKPTNGIQFTYLDSLGAVTATPASVRLIEVTLRTDSGIQNSQGRAVSDSITARIYTRN